MLFANVSALNRWIIVWLPLLLAFSGNALACELDELIQKAGNSASDEARLNVLGDLLKLSELPCEQRLEAQQLVKEIRRYQTSKDNRSRPK